MIPVLTPVEMREVDRAAPELVDVLIERAGAAVARSALRLLGGGYGRRVVVVAGKGNNGADGRAAAARLRRRGVGVVVVDAGDAPTALPACDLVVDAAYGTGFRGAYRAPHPGATPVLAVDIPSGVDGLTGEASDGAVRAGATVTFAALKPGLLLDEGRVRAGVVDLADIGLDTSCARAHVVEPADVAGWLPDRPLGAHKYWAGVSVVAGSPGMVGAALLCVRAALRAGSGYVRLGSPGVAAADLPVGEHVGRSLPASAWETEVLSDLSHYKALVVGPGLGRHPDTAAAVRRLVAEAPVPVLVDGDGLVALGPVADASAVLRARRAPTVLTPHEGEFASLTGAAPGPDRLDAVRRLAGAAGAVVLLKGPTTIVADPRGDALLVTGGDARLATAGTGDVLSGVIGALLAMGVTGLRAAAGGASLHAAAGHLGFSRGLVAGDLVDLLPVAVSRLEEA